ncbi:MAG: hypothetical protein WCG98_09740 [bacterium]
MKNLFFIVAISLLTQAGYAQATDTVAIMNSLQLSKGNLLYSGISRELDNHNQKNYVKTIMTKFENEPIEEVRIYSSSCLDKKGPWSLEKLEIFTTNDFQMPTLIISKEWFLHNKPFLEMLVEVNQLLRETGLCQDQ